MNSRRPSSISRYIISMARACLMGLSTLVIATLLTLTPLRFTQVRSFLLKCWGRSLTQILGVHVTLEGQIPQEGVILIANHTSYADVPILMGLNPCAFLAKIEVSKWPLIGWGARVAGTVFVDRSSPESRAESRAELKRRVDGGTMILVFSEGTTTPRGEVHPLKPGMFHEAASAQVPIQVVSLEYADEEAGWTGDDPIWPNFVRVFGGRKTKVRVCFRRALLTGEDGLEMAQVAEEWLRDEAAKNSRLVSDLKKV